MTPTICRFLFNVSSDAEQQKKLLSEIVNLVHQKNASRGKESRPPMEFDDIITTIRSTLAAHGISDALLMQGRLVCSNFNMLTCELKN